MSAILWNHHAQLLGRTGIAGMRQQHHSRISISYNELEFSSALWRRYIFSALSSLITPGQNQEARRNHRRAGRHPCIGKLTGIATITPTFEQAQIYHSRPAFLNLYKRDVLSTSPVQSYTRNFVSDVTVITQYEVLVKTNRGEMHPDCNREPSIRTLQEIR